MLAIHPLVCAFVEWLASRKPHETGRKKQYALAERHQPHQFPDTHCRSDLTLGELSDFPVCLVADIAEFPHELIQKLR